MTTVAMTTTAGSMTDGQRRPRGWPILGLRPRVLGWYVLLVGLALVFTSLITFGQATRAQERAADEELREEVRDFEAGLIAGTNDGLTLREAVDSYVQTWPEADRDSIAVAVGRDVIRGGGTLGDDPALAELARAAVTPQLVPVRTRAGEVRALVTPLLVDGQRRGGLVVAHPVEADRDALLDRRLAVLAASALAFLLASAIAWFTLGRLLRPVKEMATAADAIAVSGDLTRRIDVTARNDEVGLLATTFNRMLERLEASFQREQRFIREASHELRTPITICRGHLEVLGTDPDPADVREAIAVVIDELARMGRIVEDMATLARVEDPGFIRVEPVDLDRFIGDVARAAEPLLDGRLRVGEVPTGAVVRCDPQRMAQAVLNLLQNARRHAGAGPVRLDVREVDGWWRIEVSDNGGGIAVGDEERIFRPFARGDSRAPGSGMGLAIVRGIAEAHGGRAGLDNRTGEGCTFWVMVPA